VRRSLGASALVAALAFGSAACRDKGGGPDAAQTTVSSGAALSPTSAASDAGPVTEADVAEVDQVLRRLDSELDRLDSDMATGEGDTQQVRLEAAKTVAANAITRRLLALRHLTGLVPSLTRVSEADRTALAKQLEGQINGLTTLNGKIQGAADPATIRADASRIVTDYRVYVLTIPKARGVVATGIELTAADRLTSLADRLAVTIDQAQAKGNDTAQALTDLTSLRTRLGAVTGPVSALPAVLLALQPADYPGNSGVVEQGRQTLRTGRVGLADAASLARQVIADLK
jgi:hypothetical protein